MQNLVLGKFHLNKNLDFGAEVSKLVALIPKFDLHGSYKTESSYCMINFITPIEIFWIHKLS